MEYLISISNKLSWAEPSPGQASLKIILLSEAWAGTCIFAKAQAELVSNRKQILPGIYLEF